MVKFNGDTKANHRQKRKAAAAATNLDSRPKNGDRCALTRMQTIVAENQARLAKKSFFAQEPFLPRNSYYSNPSFDGPKTMQHTRRKNASYSEAVGQYDPYETEYSSSYSSEDLKR